ncbi:hypothetical protein DFR41_104222 [Pseudacidovorax intermedius]|uniref:Uncharacterized protein n=1 Tax=Pseudacidovorax intermedius TaxID=433924 RepID=A0A370FFH1_9BURK|nr:hypothetical protein [Pseudacidovorax intermedius]RDI25166.1 hypothetical protein DFR41_104222 [Pseudacidovorax intermedius]
MSGVQHNAHEAAARIAARAAALPGAVRREMLVQGGRVAVRMRELAPKAQSLLANSIRPVLEGDTVAIRPAMPYAGWRERGTRPGPIPRFEDPAATDLVRWLERRAFAGTRTPRRGSRAAAGRSRELRDRYEGLAWHIRRRGTQATPFVEPTARELAGSVAQALRRVVLASSGAGGTS